MDETVRSANDIIWLAGIDRIPDVKVGDVGDMVYNGGRCGSKGLHMSSHLLYRLQNSFPVQLIWMLIKLLLKVAFWVALGLGVAIACIAYKQIGLLVVLCAVTPIVVFVWVLTKD